MIMNDKIKVMSESDVKIFLNLIMKGIDDQFKLFQKQQDRIEEKVSDACKKIESLEMQVAKQYDNCQNTKDVDELKKNIEKHNGIVANWKIYLIAAAVVFAGIMIVINERYVKLKEITIPNTEYRQKQDSIQEVKDVKEIKSILKKSE